MRMTIPLAWRKAPAGAILGAALLLGLGSPAFATGTLDDWWLCVEKCDDEDPVCVDACTDEYNASHVADPIRSLKLKTKPPTSGRTAHSAVSLFGARCPVGSALSPFDMPIYDDDGLFVVGFETIWVCLPANLEPAG